MLWHAVLTELGYYQAEAWTSVMRYDPWAQKSPYSMQQTQGIVAVWNLKENPTYCADLAQLTITLGPVTQRLQGHQFYSKNNLGA